MADPVTLMLVAGGMQAMGAIAQGNAQSAQLDAQANNYRAQADAAAYNANITRQQAEATAQQTSAREDLQRKQARQVFGRQLAAGAESGVSLTTGSAADVFRQSLYDAEMDALNIRYEGEMNRVGLLNQASLLDWEGEVSKTNAVASNKMAKQAQKAGYLNAAIAMTGAAAGAYGMKGAPTGGGSSMSLAKGTSSTGLRAGGGTGLRVGSGSPGLRY
jgi:hypothetical protein